MTECPSAATLARILLDTHEDATYRAVESHVERCARCREDLEKLGRAEVGATEARFPPPDSLPDIPGFELLRVLGRGGMGIVYLARQKNADRFVALKIVRSGPESRSRERERWLREARAFSKVRHENVVTLFEFGEWEGWLYLVLDFIPGGTVEDRLKVPYAPRDASSLVLSVAEAVSAIHVVGLLHLDLKPSNVFLDAPPDVPRELARPRVGDLGIARRWDETGVSVATASLGGPMGSPSHMAPEQIVAERTTLGPTCDVYGLGALLYHVLTGHPPFMAPSVIETLDQVRRAEPVPPRRLNSKIPRDLETICLKCLDKEPRRRYQAASEVAEDLRRYLDGRPIQARPTSAPMRVMRWCRRRPVVAALSAILILLLATGLPAITLLWRRAELERIRTEADFRVVSDALFENIQMMTGGNGARPLIPYQTTDEATPRVILRHLQGSRASILELSRRRPDDSNFQYVLQLIDCRMARLSEELGDLASTRVLLEEARVSAESCLDRVPDDPWTLASCLSIYKGLIELDERESLKSELEIHNLQMLKICKKLSDKDENYITILKDNHYGGLGELSVCDVFRSCSGVFETLGDNAAAISALLEGIAFADRIPSDALTPDVVLVRSYCRAELSRLQAKVCQSVPTIGVLTPLDFLLTSQADGLSPARWAHEVASALEREAPGNEAARLLVEMLFVRAATDRRNGRLGDAERSGERTLEFAKLLAGRNPKDPAVQIILGDALIQGYKNALRRNNWSAAESALIQSLDAATLALQLDPGSERARLAIDQRRTRLEKLRNRMRMGSTPGQN